MTTTRNSASGKNDNKSSPRGIVCFGVISMDSERTAAVLSRVFSTRTEEVKLGESPRLRELMGERREALSEVEYLTAGCHDKGISEGLVRTKKELYHHMAVLEREYFLLTGDTYYPEGRVNTSGSLLSLLRRVYLRAENAAETFKKASQETENMHLRSVYAEIAADSRRTAARFRALVARMM